MVSLDFTLVAVIIYYKINVYCSHNYLVNDIGVGLTRLQILDHRFVTFPGWYVQWCVAFVLQHIKSWKMYRRYTQGRSPSKVEVGRRTNPKEMFVLEEDPNILFVDICSPTILNGTKYLKTRRPFIVDKKVKKPVRLLNKICFIWNWISVSVLKSGTIHLWLCYSAWRSQI